MTSTSSSTGEQAGYAVTLQDQIPRLMKRHVIPGAVVLIRSRDQGDWSATFGTREIGKDLPLSTDDYFRVGSNTKTMTSTVILQLVQEGVLESIQPTDPTNPGAAGYGLGIARFGPSVIGHDGQLPGFMTFMGYDPQAQNTIIVATNLATVPEGEGQH